MVFAIACLTFVVVFVITLFVGALVARLANKPLFPPDE